MSVPIADASRQAQLLTAAAAESPVLQVRASLEVQASEWRRAAVWAEEIGDEAVIEMAGAVIPGMHCAYDDPEYEWLRVQRTLNGGLSLHLDHPRMQSGVYRNFAAPFSPVVVRA